MRISGLQLAEPKTPFSQPKAQGSSMELTGFSRLSVAVQYLRFGIGSDKVWREIGGSPCFSHQFISLF